MNKFGIKILAKIIMLLMCCFLTACTNSGRQSSNAVLSTTIEDKAFQQLQIYINEHVCNPATYQKHDIKVICKNDSICVINFRAIEETPLGGHANVNRQYALMKHHDTDYYELFWDEDLTDEGVTMMTVKRYLERNDSFPYYYNDMKIPYIVGLRQKAKTLAEKAYADMWAINCCPVSNISEMVHKIDSN